MQTINRSALVVKPAQPFLDWLHRVDTTSTHLTLDELRLEPTIYLLPDTGMADPNALGAAFERYAASGGGGSIQDIPVGGLRGLTLEGLNAAGNVRIDHYTGVVASLVRGLPSRGTFDLWLMDNKPATGHSTFVDASDTLLKIGTYTAFGPGIHRLFPTSPGAIPAGFFPDRAFVVRAGQTPATSFVLTGGSSVFDRLTRSQVRLPSDAGAADGISPVPSPTRSDSFAVLIAEGRRLFNKEPFNGNGRACGTCHVENNNFTIDPELIAKLPQSDPLFVAETNPALQGLENNRLLRTLGLFGVSADSFDRPMVFRSAQNVQALRNSMLRPDPTFFGDLTSNGRNGDPAERLGRGNDGPPLRDFAIVAIAQHAPRSLLRRPGIDFRVPTDEELDALAAYQLALGRQEDFQLSVLELKSSQASRGKVLFLDTGNLGETGHKNCNACHFNAGGTGAFAANPTKAGFPRLDGSPHGGNIVAPTNVNETPLALSLGLPRDGGFGQVYLPLFGSFGNSDELPAPLGHVEVEEFNSGTVVESADTGPFFHNHTVQDLESAVAFYGTPAFQSGRFSIGRPGFGVTPVTISSDPNDAEVQAISSFLRVLNTLENIRSAIELSGRARSMANDADAKELAGLAHAEIEDAVDSLSRGALASSKEAGILHAANTLRAALRLAEGARRALARQGLEGGLAAVAQLLRDARSALANPSTLPGSYQQ